MSTVKSTLSLNSTGQIPAILNFSRSSSATRINSIGLVETLAANIIRQDYHSDPANTGRLRGWLLEESSTNTCLQSADFGTTWITSTSTLSNSTTVNTNAVKSPDGTTNADGVVASANGDNKIVAVRQQGFTFTSGTSYTVSVWAKKNVHNFLEISNEDNDGAGRTYSQVFNLATGATGASGGTVDAASIEEYANGWYRCQVSFTAGASTTTDVYFKSRPDDAVSNDYTVVASSGMYLWGAQVEELAYATSYIPTTTVSVTRTADVAYIEDTEGMWNWNVGTSIWIDATPLNTTETVTPIYHYQDATNANYISLLSDASVKITTNGSSQLASNPLDTGFTNTRHEDFRNVLSLESNRFHMAQNGSLSGVLPDTSVTVPMNSSASAYTIKFFHGTGLTSGSGWLSNFRIYSNVVTDLELQNLSFRKNDDAQNLAMNAVQVLDGSITNLKLADDAVTSGKIADGTIVGGNIANGAIQALQIGDDQVTQAKIAAGAVGATEIAANSIGTAHLGVDVIVAEDIAANAITVSELQDGAVIANKIAINAVDGTKIALGSDAQGDIMYYSGTDYVRLPKGTSGQVLTMNATVPTWAADSTDVGGTAVGGDVSGTVSNITIPNGAITSAMIGVDVIVAEDIANNAITVAELSDNSVSTAKIQANAVDGTKIAMGSDAAGDVLYYDGTDYVRLAKGTSGHVLTQGATAPQWAADSTNVSAAGVGGDLTGTVGNASIDSNTVGIAQLNVTDGSAGQYLTTDGNGALSFATDSTNVGGTSVGGDISGTVSNAQIIANAVGATEIAANAVNGTHIALGSDAAGDVMYYNGTDYARLGAGTAGQVLKMNSGATAPEWAADIDTTIGDASVGGDVSGTISNIQIAANTISDSELITSNSGTNGQVLSLNGAGALTWKDDTDTTIGDAAVGGDVSGTISNIQISANAIDGTHISLGSDAAGDIMYYNGTNYVRLAKGTAGQVLTVNSGATAPEWAADSTNVSATAVGGMLTGTVANASIAAGVVTPTMLSASGTASSSTFLRGDGQWATVPMVETDPTAVTMAIALG